MCHSEESASNDTTSHDEWYRTVYAGNSTGIIAYVRDKSSIRTGRKATEQGVAKVLQDSPGGTSKRQLEVA